MPRTSRRRHTGRTESGSTKDVKVERLGRVTVYQRGKSYYLYYREAGKSVRKRVEGNLATARLAASKVTASLEEGSPSLFGFTRVTIDELTKGFLGYCQDVQGLSLRTLDRYRAALGHLTDFAKEQCQRLTADQVTDVIVEDFVKWLRAQSRTRNGAEEGERAKYTQSGVKFILATCRTAFNWASKRRYLPPYGENPFSTFPIDKVFGREKTQVRILSLEEQRAFFDACDDWQRPIFLFLGIYGLRVGELTHLLVSDVDLDEGSFTIRSKTEMFWSVKTQRERDLPILPELEEFFRRLAKARGEGFLFLNRTFVQGEDEPISFVSRAALQRELKRRVEEAQTEGSQNEKDLKRVLAPFLRELGQIPEKRIRQEFMKITKKIGCPEVTRAHSLRHLFSTRAQEQGLNPLLVQEMLGHTTMDMTRRYTHFRIDAQRQAVSEMLKDDPVMQATLEKMGS